jgi:Holliday junction resolvase
MDLRPKGIAWNRQLWERIERKGGAHYRAPCSDYIDVERKIEAHELRYADRVEVYVTGQKYMDTVVVLNGGVYMSTGIKDEADEPITVRQAQLDAHRDDDPTDINPDRGVWSDPKPITEGELNESAVYWHAQAEDSRRRSRFWIGVAFASTLVLIGVLAIPNELILLLFDAFE